MLRDDEYRQHLHEAKDSEEIARIIEQYEYNIV